MIFIYSINYKLKSDLKYEKPTLLETNRCFVLNVIKRSINFWEKVFPFGGTLIGLFVGIILIVTFVLTGSIVGFLVALSKYLMLKKFY